jgi:hypothetical protein
VTKTFPHHISLDVDRIAKDILDERLRQADKYPQSESGLPDGTGGGARATWEAQSKAACDRAEREGRLTFAHIFEEEASEVLNATDPEKLRTELVQVAAICVKWAADLDRRGRK